MCSSVLNTIGVARLRKTKRSSLSILTTRTEGTSSAVFAKNVFFLLQFFFHRSCLLVKVKDTGNFEGERLTHQKVNALETRIETIHLPNTVCIRKE